MAVIYLIRHGQASFDAADYDALSPLGFKQAHFLGEQLARNGVKPSRVIAGAMRRHRETCETALDAMALAANQDTDAQLNEYDHVEVIAKHWPLFTDRPAAAQWATQQSNPKQAFIDIFDQAILHWQQQYYPYDESWQQFRQRVETGFKQLTDNASGTVLVFTSGGVISVILNQLLGLPDTTFLRFSKTLVNSGVTRIVKRQGELQLASLNEHLHLPKSFISYR